MCILSVQNMVNHGSTFICNQKEENSNMLFIWFQFSVFFLNEGNSSLCPFFILYANSAVVIVFLGSYHLLEN